MLLLLLALVVDDQDGRKHFWFDSDPGLCGIHSG
jgi:hypothetical protein